MTSDFKKYEKTNFFVSMFFFVIVGLQKVIIKTIFDLSTIELKIQIRVEW